MKKNYIKPFVEMIEFQPKDMIMDDVNIPGIGGGITESIPTGEEWEDPWA